MSVLFVTTRAALMLSAARAAERAGVQIVCAGPEEAGKQSERFDTIVVPAAELGRLGQAIKPGCRLVVYGRDIASGAASLPAGAITLEEPFRVDDLAAAMKGGGTPATTGHAAEARSAEHAAEHQPAARAAAAREAEGTVGTGKKGYKILAADDDMVLRRIYQSVLGEAGYTVLAAKDGEEAWGKLPSFGPDLVITDVEMPGISGYELCRRVKEHPQWAQIPVIVCSSLHTGRDVVKAFESGSDDYLIKPIHEEELLARVGELLASIEQSGREKILVVDDSRIIRNLIRGGLTKQGFEVETAGNGKEALDIIARMEELPAIVISDFEMPEMDGFEMGMALRATERTHSLPLIMMSARDDDRNRRLMRTAGAVGFLGKPFEPDKMVALVERVLAEQRLKAEKSRIRELIADDAMAQMVREVRLGKRGLARAEKMTLLFSDLKGFSTMCSRLEAPDVVDLLNRYFDAMIPPIRDAQGDVDKFIGDAIMARFRDPDDGMPREPSPMRAIRAGLGMIHALEQFNSTLPEDHQLHMRIGINWGEVVIGAIGASSRRDYTTIGDNVNRAQRLESNATPDCILIAEDTYQIVKGRVRVHLREEKIKLKGIPEPVFAYDVLGLEEGV